MNANGMPAVKNAQLGQRFGPTAPASGRDLEPGTRPPVGRGAARYAGRATPIPPWALCLAVVVGLLVWTARSPAAAPTIESQRVLECGPCDGQRPAVVTSVAVTPDGKTIAAASDDHRIRLWDAASGSLRLTLNGHQDWVRALALSPDGKTLASGANDHSVVLWNSADGERLFRMPSGDKPVAAMAFHPNGQQLAVAGFCERLHIINTSTGQVSQELECPSCDVRAVAFSPDGEWMAIAGRDGQIRLWNVIAGELERDIPVGHQRLRALAFSPDSRRLVAAGDCRHIHLVDLEDAGEDVTLPARPARVYAAVFMDNQTLATGGSDNQIRIWDLPSRSVRLELVGHTGSVAALACDGSASLLVSGSYDTTLRVWNLDEPAAAKSLARSPSEAAR